MAKQWAVRPDDLGQRLLRNPPIQGRQEPVTSRRLAERLESGFMINGDGKGLLLHQAIRLTRRVLFAA
jgi:hypothetical protein